MPGQIVGSTVSLAVVALAGCYFVALGMLSLASPRLANDFLFGFAGSPARHFTEMASRLAAGAAFVAAAPQLPSPGPFAAFGWVLVATTLVLMLVPWRLHQRFAQVAVARAVSYLPFIGITSLIVGLAILGSVCATWAA